MDSDRKPKLPRFFRRLWWRIRNPKLIERERAIIVYWSDGAHDGPGWYFYGEDYPDEGSFGAYATQREAEKAAVKHGYRVSK